MTISDKDYNSARAILAAAGSASAAASHDKHNTKGGSPEGHGKSLLQEARDDFRRMDVGGAIYKSDMTKAHYDAIHKAADKMGITSW